jgi:hypothetical protein
MLHIDVYNYFNRATVTFREHTPLQLVVVIPQLNKRECDSGRVLDILQAIYLDDCVHLCQGGCDIVVISESDLQTGKQLCAANEETVRSSRFVSHHDWTEWKGTPPCFPPEIGRASRWESTSIAPDL